MKECQQWRRINFRENVSCFSVANLIIVQMSPSSRNITSETQQNFIFFVHNQVGS
jgi:hypothetical protein